MIDWAILLPVIPAAGFLTWLVLRGAMHRQLLDHPVARSAHTIPVPVGGGVSFVFLFYLVLTLWWLQGQLESRIFLASLGGILVALVGLVDDLRRLGIRTRLSLQFAAAVWTVVWLGETANIQIGYWTLSNPWLVGLLSVVAMVWLINLYNFMDGIDGLAGAELCTVTAMSCLLAANAGAVATANLSALLGFAVAGFLWFNWSPARIFMGDVGSGFLGYGLGFLALISLAEGSVSLWAWLLLLGVFVVDATVTLARRLLGGQAWLEGHNTHAYQHVARRFGRHAPVTLIVMLITLFWLSPLAIYANAFPASGVFLALLGMVPLALLATGLGAGRSN